MPTIAEIPATPTVHLRVPASAHEAEDSGLLRASQLSAPERFAAAVAKL